METPPTAPLFAEEPQRETAEALRRQGERIQGLPLVQAILDAVPGGVALLNASRQVIAANEGFLSMADAAREAVLGRRLGEIFGCPFWREGAGGCGTSRQCQSCGALQALRRSLAAADEATGECSFTRDGPIRGTAAELRLKATPLAVGEERLTVCCLQDISAEKRLGDMSAIFFHDVLNTISGIHGHLDLLGPHVVGGDGRDDLERLRWLVDHLADEVESQRDLTLAERGDLAVQPQVVRTTALLDDLRRACAVDAAGTARRIEVCDSWNGIMVTDIRLLSRVLGNMIRNALEAIAPHDAVTVRCRAEGEEVRFEVHNPGAIPEPLQQQLFKRRVSTKSGPHRGVGTRSMKLLGETYLQGRVSFTSSAGAGTTFVLAVPRVLTALVPPDGQGDVQ